jgi:hypothetical protein
MSVTTKAKLEFVYLMAKHSTATLAQCQRLMRYAATHQHLADDACNGPDYSNSRTELNQKYVTEAWNKRQEVLPKKRDRIEQKIKKICEEFSGYDAHPGQVTPVFSGDPRGCTVKIRVLDGYTNDFGGEGICVPA